MRTFQQSALSVPSAHRCIQSSPGQWNLPLEHCLFGFPQNDAFGWTALNQMPNRLKGIYFYLGGECVQLVSDFANSDYPQHIEQLVIGNSSSYRVEEGSHMSPREYDLIDDLMHNAAFLE